MPQGGFVFLRSSGQVLPREKAALLQGAVLQKERPSLIGLSRVPPLLFDSRATLFHLSDFAF
jgi:hypothetical protein